MLTSTLVRSSCLPILPAAYTTLPAHTTLQAKVGRSVQTSHVKSWLHSHGYVVKADKLHPAVTRVM